MLEGEYLKALVGAAIIGVVAPVVGTWIVLRRMANLGDTMSHGTLAGVGIAYAAGANILLGALGAGVVIAVLADPVLGQPDGSATRRSSP